MLVSDDEVGLEIWRREIQQRVYLFHVYGGLIAPMRSEWLQGAFGSLTGFLNQAGLRINTGKKVGVVCKP